MWWRYEVPLCGGWTRLRAYGAFDRSGSRASRALTSDVQQISDRSLCVDDTPQYFALPCISDMGYWWPHFRWTSAVVGSFKRFKSVTDACRAVSPVGLYSIV